MNIHKTDGRYWIGLDVHVIEQETGKPVKFANTNSHFSF